MIKLYTWSTPNGMKTQLMLEECALPYEIVPVNLGAKHQYSRDFLAINPNGKIPAIVDQDGPNGSQFTLWESGAILMYLAEKSKRFVPVDAADRHRVNQWIMFQMSGVGPMIGQFHHFLASAPDPLPYAIERYRDEGARLLGVVDKHLMSRHWLVSADITMADFCMWPWMRSWLHTVKQTFDGFPHLARWFQEIEQRPATVKAVETYLALRGHMISVGSAAVR